MDKNLRQVVLACPEVLRYLDLPGIERAALGFEIMLAAVSRDSHGHFYKDGGAPCPHSKGKAEPSETPESVKRKEEGVRAIKFVMRNGEPSEMRTASGRKVVFERGTAKYGVEHFKLRRFNSGDAKTDADFDKIIDGVSKAIANAEPYFARTRNIVFDYKKYRAICCEDKKRGFNLYQRVQNRRRSGR